MEECPTELKPIENQEQIQHENSNSNLAEELANKEDEEPNSDLPPAKRPKLEDEEEVDENLECLKSLCESVSGANEVNSASTPDAQNPEQDEVKTNNSSTTKKKKKKKKPVNSKVEEKKEKTGVPPSKKSEKSKSHMRRNIRDILKDNELEAETRAAQQRELERVQRLQQQQQQVQQQQQQADQSFIPSFELDDDNNPTSLVEDLQALAKELEGSSLSPELPFDFISNNSQQQLNSGSSSITTCEPPKEDLRQGNVKKFECDDVICLSSDDEEFPPKPVVPVHTSKPYIPNDDDDDDVVILSGDDEKPEVVEQEDGDVNNFGLHTQDHLNQPDNEGRVLVNVGHPSKENDIFLATQLARAAKPHQIGGIRFLYDNVVESLEQYAISPGFGCILAHSMGLGKTFQVCAFSDVFLRSTNGKTVLIIVPINTIQNWVAEFNHWLPAEAPNSSSDNDPPIQTRHFQLHVLNDSTKDFNSRFKVINDWSTIGGVLLIGYEMYRMFYTTREGKAKRSISKKKKSTGLIDLEEEEMVDKRDKEQIERIYQALVNPGPELVICDEGHRIKNMKTGISVALKEIRTRRRVVLTGYPLQNNLLEYWCMVDFVRPNFLGTRTEFGNMFERPIQNGQCLDSSPADVKLMKERVYVLHSLVKGFVQRRSHAVLRTSLPRKEEHVLMLRLTPLQRALYRHHMSDLVQNKSVSNPLKAFAICLKIWNHPDVLYNFAKKQQDDLDLDLDEEPPESRKGRTKKAAANSNPTPPSLPAVVTAPTDDESLEGGANGGAKDKKEIQEPASLDWANEILKGYTPGDIENAAKTQVFFTILEESVKIGDRLLVFSQSLFTLNLLEEFLQQRKIPDRQDERWTKNRSYFRLDGSTNGLEREKLVNEFNANSDVLLFLISTRAGSLGINLIGANRVVVFDASWNPCHDAQAVCRVYRYGQKKPCYIYRLVTDNSLEKKIYDRQIGKQGTADRVVDELNPEARLSLRDVTSLVCDDEEDPPPKDYGVNRNPHLNLTDPILENVLQNFGSSFTKDPFQHEALLVESKESKLSKAEKRMAQRLYEKAKMDGNTQYRRSNSYSSYYPKMPLPIPTMSSSNNPGYYNRNSSYPTSIRPPGIPPKPVLNPSLPGLGMDLLEEALAQGKLVCKEMLLSKDVTIARNQLTSSGNADGSPVVLPAGTRVKLIKTPKGIYMQTPEGKIFRIHSSTPATNPTSTSTMAAALGMGSRSSFSQSTSALQQNYGYSNEKSQMDEAMMRKFREMQSKTLGADGKQVISFNDKSTLLAQIRQNLSSNRPSGLPGLAGLAGSCSSIPASYPPLSSASDSLTQFAKQLAILAKKSAVESDLTGSGGSLSEVESGSSNSGLSPKRPSSLLDPKARALPSASLPRKVATVTPNLSRARNFTPHRPRAAVEPLIKITPEVHASSASSMLASLCSAPSALSALSALSASPMIPSPMGARRSELSSELLNFTAKSDVAAVSKQPTDDSDSGSGLFHNLSLASQLEGFASSTSTAVTSAAESLKDLLKTPSETPTTSSLQWNGEQASASGGQGSNYSWSNYAQWNGGAWNGGSVTNQPDWSSNPWPAQQQPQQQQVFSNGNGNTEADVSATSGDFSNSTMNFANFSGNSSHQWPNYGSNGTASASTPTSSVTGYQQAINQTDQSSQYPTPSYFPNSYLNSPNNTPAFESYPQSNGLSGFPNLGNYNSYNSHTSNSFPPNYSQPYPGSFSQ